MFFYWELIWILLNPRKLTVLSFKIWQTELVQEETQNIFKWYFEGVVAEVNVVYSAYLEE